MKAYQRNIYRQINPQTKTSDAVPTIDQSLSSSVPKATLNHMRDLIDRVSKKNAE